MKPTEGRAWRTTAYFAVCCLGAVVLAELFAFGCHPAHADEIKMVGWPYYTGHAFPDSLTPGRRMYVTRTHVDTLYESVVGKDGEVVTVQPGEGLSAPPLRYFACTAPVALDVRGNCDAGGGQARSQLYVVLYAALRKPRWDSPLVIVALDSTGYVEPGSQVTLSTAFRDTGATFFVRSRNMAGYSCWSNLVGP